MLSIPALAARLAAFAVERHPFALEDVMAAFDAAAGGRPATDGDALDHVRTAFVRELARRLEGRSVPALSEVTPRVTAAHRFAQASAEVVEDCDGCLRRLALEASLTGDERREMLRGMMLTRATDNRLKSLYAAGEIRCEGTPFQGKGFRSLGQEAVYAAAIRLRRGPTYRGLDGRWTGDVVAPMIRDLGVAIGSRLDVALPPDRVRVYAA
jgi:hypothetical protein